MRKQLITGIRPDDCLPLVNFVLPCLSEHLELLTIKRLHLSP